MANLMVDTGIAPRSVETRKKYYDVMSESVNGRIQVRSMGSTRREYTIKYPPMTRAQFVDVWQFIDDLNGRYGTFEVYVPAALSGASFDFTTGQGCNEVSVRLANDVQEFSIGVTDVYEFEIDVVEVL